MPLLRNSNCKTMLTSPCYLVLHRADGPEPEYKPDSEYPDWLWKVLDEKPLLEDYVMKVSSTSAVASIVSLALPHVP